MYKLRIYRTTGLNRGNLHHEEKFETKEEMNKRYIEFIPCESIIPTAWEQIDGEWKRLAGY